MATAPGNPSDRRYRIGIDVGGTFTDFVMAERSTGALISHKEPSVPSDPARAIARGISQLLKVEGAEAGQIEVITHGTTIGLNSIIQERGCRVALVVSRGNRDVMELARGRLPSSYNFKVGREKALVGRRDVFEDRFGRGNGKSGQDQAFSDNPEDCLPEGSIEKGVGRGSEVEDSRIDAEKGKGRQPEGALEDGLGTGMAEVDEWLEFKGTVESVASDLWIIILDDGEHFEIEGRALSFIQDSGFTVHEGESLTLTSFMEEDDFEVGGIENDTTGENISIRDETGRPLWVGGYRGGQNH